MKDKPTPADVIRQATAADGPAIVELVQALAAFERLPPPDAAAQARLLHDAFGPAPRFRILVAECGGRLAGYAFFFETYSTFRALPTLYLEDLFVLATFRGQGLGRLLLQACAHEAQRRGCGRFEWAVLDWNADAIRFYEHLGARHLDDWRIYRLEGEALTAAAGGAPPAE